MAYQKLNSASRFGQAVCLYFSSLLPRTTTNQEIASILYQPLQLACHSSVTHPHVSTVLASQRTTSALCYTRGHWWPSLCSHLVGWDRDEWRRWCCEIDAASSHLWSQGTGVSILNMGQKFAVCRWTWYRSRYSRWSLF